MSDQFETMEAREGESAESLTLRDYFTQLTAVAESAGGDGCPDWISLDERIGIDVEPEVVSSARPVYTVAVPAREDGLYVFADHGQAVAFADAVTTTPSRLPTARVEDPPVNDGGGAEQLIASERAALLEDIAPEVGEDVREGKVPLPVIQARLGTIPDTADAKALVGHWIEVDEQRVAAVAELATEPGGEAPEPIVSLVFTREDIDSMADEQGVDRAVAWARAQEWRKAIIETNTARINEALLDAIGTPTEPDGPAE